MTGSTSAQRPADRYGVCLGITPWKRKNFLQFLGDPGGARSVYWPLSDWRGAVLEAKSREGLVYCWASSAPEGLIDFAQSEGVDLVLVEDGFLRSQGLGIKLHMPLSLCFSTKGIHYDCRTASDLECRLNEMVLTPRQTAIGERLLKVLRRDRISKYNTGGVGFDWSAVAEEGQKRIVVVGQVEDDASMLTGSPDLRSNLGLLQRVREMNPDAAIVYRPHPDVVCGLRRGRVPNADLAGLADAVSLKEAIYSLMDEADEIHVITSQTGLEALILGKAVVCHGQPFYSGYGLTTDLSFNARRTRPRSLEELLYIALADYPSYINPFSGDPIDVFEAIELLRNARNWPRAPRSFAIAVWLRRKNRILGNLMKRAI